MATIFRKCKRTAFFRTFVKSRDFNMEKDYTVFEDCPFDCEKIGLLDMEAVDTGIEEGNRYLESQNCAIGHIDDNLRMMLGWLVGAMMALIGTLVLSVTSEIVHVSVIIASAYELLYAFILSIYIIRNGMYGNTVYIPGDSPSHLFRDKALEALKDFDKYRTKYLKGWYLDEIQFRIMQNKTVQARKVVVYRRALVTGVVGLISGGILLIVLLLFGI